jgi:hypothetical protein
LQTNTSTSRHVFRVHLRNVGQVPARDFKGKVTVIADGVILPTDAVEEEKFAVAFPGVSHIASSGTSNKQEYERISNASTLSLIFNCSYKGATDKEYRSEAKTTYSKKTKLFSIVRYSAE